MDVNKINPTFIEHEGFFYLEYEGEFFKGCKRCGGEGHYSFNGEHSYCYACDNTAAKLGEQLADRAAAERWCHQRALRRAQRERQAVAKAKAAQDARDQRVANTDPVVVEALRKVYEIETEAYQTGDYTLLSRQNSFMRTMASKLFNAAENGLTDNMVEAVKKIAEKDAQRAAEAAALPPVPEGRQRVTGVVASIKVVDTDFGVAVKVLVKDDRGFKVYGTLANALANAKRVEFGEGTEGTWLDLAAGCRVAFTATLKPSQDDPSFGFASRPTNGEWL